MKNECGEEENGGKKHGQRDRERKVKRERKKKQVNGAT